MGNECAVVLYINMYLACLQRHPKEDIYFPSIFCLLASTARLPIPHFLSSCWKPFDRSQSPDRLPHK